MSDVTPYELELVRNFRQMKPVQREMVFDMVASLAEDLRAERQADRKRTFKVIQGGATA